ncbi:unnamed protein product [Owenia fusiformis]|uniref:BZIP domain-containing protein n=1 Tax=Owenia fusiformis TaxID=6347 RepID=A0A8S4N2W8_OWEFU|nr:unnamed protein product [Owenia fusiformis]
MDVDILNQVNVHGYKEKQQQDLDLIEVLWRQDIDLGVGREVFDINLRKELEKERELELQKQKEEQLLQESQKQKELDPYATGNWIIDSETGEYLPGPPEAENVPVVNTTDSSPNITNGNTQNTNESFSSMEETMRILEKEAEEGMMILNGTLNIAQQQQQPPQVEPVQNTNIESTWQDLVSVLNLTNENAEANVTMQELAPTVDNSTENVLLQNASLPQLGTFNSINETMNRNAQANNFTSDIIAQSYNSSVPSINNTGTTLNLDTGDLFPNITNTTETNGLLQSILEDEGLDPYDLPDLDVDQDMQMMDDASSDSAVSMGGSLSPSQHSQINETASVSSNPFDGMEGATGGSDYNKQSKYQDYERYSYDQRYSTSSNDSFLNHSMSNETEYKHIVPDMKHIRHNHTYPEQPPVVVERKAPKKKPPKIKEEPLFSSRDEKKAKQMKIPLTMDQIIHSHVDEFNDLLQKHPLKDNQLQLIRDIRRRGKNKIAAQNCRKRKMDLICGLDEEVQKLREQRDQLAKAKRMVDKETIQMKEKFGHLYQEVFSSLRDENGQPYNQQDYSLQQSADGNVFLVPRNRSTNVTNEHKTKPSRKRKGHSRN